MHKKIMFISSLKCCANQLKEFESGGINKSYADVYSSSSYLPLGLLSIQSYIHNYHNDIESKVISLDALMQNNMILNGVENEVSLATSGFDTYISRLLESSIICKDIDIVGISVLFDVSLESAISAAKFIRRHAPHAIIILGGHPVTTKYNDIFLQYSEYIEAIVFGEGEKPFLRLLETNDYFSLFNNDNSFITFDKITLRKEIFLNDYIQNLDDIPIIKYDEIIQSTNFKYNIENQFSDIQPKFNKFPLMTSRGCPHSCVFCSSHNVHGKNIRYFSIRRLKKEIDYLIEKCGAQVISIKDDHFLFDITRAIKICDYIGSKGVEIDFPNGFAMAYITKEFVDSLVRNNVKKVSLALESGSDRVLKEIIKKPLSLDRATEVFEYFRKTEIFVRVYCVVGFPGETLKDLQDALLYLNSQYFHWVGFSSATPISGSELETLVNTKIEFSDCFFSTKVFFERDISEQMNNDIAMTMNLDVNYVNNGMIRAGKYELAAKHFKFWISDNPKNAFAYYYLSECLKKLNQPFDDALNVFKEIVQTEKYWENYVRYFNLKY